MTEGRTVFDRLDALRRTVFDRLDALRRTTLRVASPPSTSVVKVCHIINYQRFNLREAQILFYF
jgi:hypothetical protein